MLCNLEYILKISYTVVFADVNSYDNVMQSISNEFISIFVLTQVTFSKFTVADYMHSVTQLRKDKFDCQSEF